MRWDELFDDLSAQASATLHRELSAEADERSRDELGRLTLADRLAAPAPGDLTVELLDGDTLSGRTAGVGDGWVCLASGADEVVVPLPAIAGIRWAGTGPGLPVDPPRAARIGLRPVLRSVVRRRAYVRVAARGGRTVGGTLDGVGADHVLLAEHPADRPRRTVEVRGVRVVPFAAMLWVRYASG